MVALDPVEIVELRGPRSKVYDLGDGRKRFVGGQFAHHSQNGILVETDCTWKDLVSDYGSGVYPYTVRLNKGQRKLTITDDVNTIILEPLNTRVPTVTVDGATIRLAGLWRGVDCLFTLTPEGPRFAFVKMSTTFTNPQIRVTGDSAWLMSAGYHAPVPPFHRPVSVTSASGVLTYDLSPAAVGVEVA